MSFDVLLSYPRFCLKIAANNSCTAIQYNNFKMVTLRLCAKVLGLYIFIYRTFAVHKLLEKYWFLSRQDKPKISISLCISIYFFIGK